MNQAARIAFLLLTMAPLYAQTNGITLSPAKPTFSVDVLNTVGTAESVTVTNSGTSD